MPRSFSVALLSFAVLGAVYIPARAATTVPASRVFDVKVHGAVGDGKTVDSDAINRAILAADAVGGGMVHFPPGVYLSASIRLKSNITLYLEAGCTIEATDETTATFDPPEPSGASA